MDDDISIMPAKGMDSVIFETDPFIPNIYISPEPHYFKVYLEAGQYLMHVR